MRVFSTYTCVAGLHTCSTAISFAPQLTKFHVTCSAIVCCMRSGASSRDQCTPKKYNLSCSVCVCFMFPFFCQPHAEPSKFSSKREIRRKSALSTLPEPFENMTSNDVSGVLQIPLRTRKSLLTGGFISQNCQRYFGTVVQLKLR